MLIMYFRIIWRQVKFSPQPSLQSFSNAMDVGNPSNFERLLAFYGNDTEKMAERNSVVYPFQMMKTLLPNPKDI